MQIPLALLADYANVTADGKLNIMGIFNTIFSTSGFPTVHPQMRLIFQLRIPPSERGSTKNIEIKLLDADGKPVLGLSSTMHVPDDLPANQEIPQILELHGVTFPTAGDYGFSILVGGEEKTVVQLHVLPLPTVQGS